MMRNFQQGKTGDSIRRCSPHVASILPSYCASSHKPIQLSSVQFEFSGVNYLARRGVVQPSLCANYIVARDFTMLTYGGNALLYHQIYLGCARGAMGALLRFTCMSELLLGLASESSARYIQLSPSLPFYLDSVSRLSRR
jgi:hypothetical protein